MTLNYQTMTQICAPIAMESPFQSYRIKVNNDLSKALTASKKAKKTSLPLSINNQNTKLLLALLHLPSLTEPN